MITPERLSAWADGFAERHGLNRASFFFQPGMEDEQYETALRSLQQIPPRFANAIVDDPAMEKWVAEILRRAGRESAGKRVMPAVTTGPSPLLLGVTGCGKTYQAYGAVRAIAAFGVQAGWQRITAPDLNARLRPRHGVDPEAEFQSIVRTRLLIVDDLGAAKNSEWVEKDVNYRLVNTRYDMELPTIFTSNLPPTAPRTEPSLTSELGDRVVSRLNEMTIPIVLDGDDRRGRVA